MKDLNVLFYRYRSKCWYLFLKTALEAVGDENRPKFFKAYFIPLKLTNLWIFCIILGKIKCYLCLKKKTGQKVNICLWNRSKSIALWSGPKSLCSRRLFECPLAVQSASPPLWQVLQLNGRPLRLELLKKRTHARHSVSSQLVKYNIIVATSLWLSARKYTKKNLVKMVFVLYSELCLTAHWAIPQV